jgi:hypothetical protein
MGGALERFSARAFPVLFVTAEYRFLISAETEEKLSVRYRLPDH